MRTNCNVPSAVDHELATEESGQRAGHGGSALPYLLVVVLMGLILLALSAAIHGAAAAALGGGWTSLGAIWLLAGGATLLAVYSARTAGVAWRRMCFVNGVASLGLLAAGITELTGPGIPPDAVRPFGPVVGIALASGLLVMAGLVLGLLFFAAWYVLSRHGAGSDHPA